MLLTLWLLPYSDNNSERRVLLSLFYSRKWSFREVNQLAQSHVASEWQGQDLRSPDCKHRTQPSWPAWTSPL